MVEFFGGGWAVGCAGAAEGAVFGGCGGCEDVAFDDGGTGVVVELFMGVLDIWQGVRTFQAQDY